MRNRPVEMLVCPGIQKIEPVTKRGKRYRARKTVNGVRLDFRTNNLSEAKKWLRNL